VRGYSKTLEIEGPSATCGACRFTSSLTGKFSVEDGRLVWRADPDPQPRRGPNLTFCGECKTCDEEFERVMAGDADLSAEDIAALRATVEYARLHEFDEVPGS
jgi:hypothetical protein